MHRLTGILILAILAGLVWVSRPRSAEPEPGPANPAAATVAGDGTATGVPIVTLDAAECADAGYLCAEIDRTGDFRAVRWPDRTERIRIRVLLPENVDPSRARELQRQAAAGIREWQGRPLALDIAASAAATGDADVTVRWVASLDGDRLGQTAIRWGVQNGVPVFAVDDLVLALHDPSGAPVAPDRVRLTAAHEMGHVLGLPHSSDEADVMYPFNTSTRLTFRDFRTIEVLYRTPAGARIVRAR
jgi:hypothetical protein